VDVTISKETIEHSGVFFDDAPVIVTITYDEYDPQDMSAKITLVESRPNHQRDAVRELRADDTGNLVLREPIGGEEIMSLTSVHGLALKGYNANLGLEGYELGFTHASIENIDRVIIQIDLTPAEILSGNIRNSLNYNGTITCEEMHSEKIEWESNYGTVRAEHRHSYEQVRAGDNRAIIQIARPRIVYDFIGGLNISATELKKNILSEVDDVALVLSLCSRKMVSWYKAEFILKGISEDSQSRQMIARRKRYARTYPKHQQPSVTYANLSSGGLAGLVSRFRESPIRESLRRSIVFLVFSHANQAIEQKFFSVFASLDAFCHSYWEQDTSAAKMPSSVWKRIEKKLRTALRELDGPDEKHAEAVKEKLPELQRPTTIKKIVHCCTMLSIPTDDLWQQEGFEAGLGGALKARNLLFHTANSEDPILLHDDCIRMQILVERLVFSLLEWPEEKLTLWYDWSLSSMNYP